MKKNTCIFSIILILTLISAAVSNAQTKYSSNLMTGKQNNDRQQDRPLKIKSKPTVELGNCSQSSGVVTLRVTFDKSATITDVETIDSSGCDSFDNKAVKAAKKIKFNPAAKNGEEVTVVKRIEYSFRKF